MDKWFLSITLVVVFRTLGVFCQCDPVCSATVSAGDKVENPKNCSNYYICLGPNDPSDNPVPCNTGEIFDAANDVCIPGDPNTCMPTCVVPGCTVTCGAGINYIPDPEDCNVFYECLPIGPSDPIQCPPQNQFFDHANELCVDHDDVCCRACIPYCEAADVNKQIPDPASCTSYYLCLEQGLADFGTNVHNPCPAGENFDPITGHCSPDTPCLTLCGGGSASVCQESLQCTDTGYFPVCTTCQPDYFHCSYVGEVVYPEQCTGGLVFDTNPNYPYCVPPANCPSG